MIRLENVSYSYGADSSFPALSGVSLSVSPGELVLCTGRSGCGKSTLIRLMNGLAPHYHGGMLTGRVLVNGEDTRESGLAAISRTVGTLFQKPATACST